MTTVQTAAPERTRAWSGVSRRHRGGLCRCSVPLYQGVPIMSASRRGLRVGTVRLIAAACGLAAACAVMISVPFASGASSNLFAVVDAAGGQVAGNGVTGITHLGPGRYEVTFTQDVSE